MQSTKPLRTFKTLSVRSSTWTAALLLPLLLFSGCAVSIKNERWYGDEGIEGAVWFETLTSATGFVDKADWDAMRVGMACTSTDTLAEIKREIEQLCSATSCDYQAVQKVLDRMQMRIDGLDEVASRLK